MIIGVDKKTLEPTSIITQSPLSIEEYSKAIFELYGGYKPIITLLPDRCIQSKGATILFWGEEKTVVKCSKDDSFNKAYGFLMAYFKKTSGLSRTQASKFISKMIGGENE